MIKFKFKKNEKEQQGDINIKKLAVYSLMVAVLLLVNFFAGSKIVNTSFPWYSNVSIFLLININIILLLVVLILIFRNLGKLFIDRKKNLFGTRLQGKLVIFSTLIAVVPVLVVFIFSSSIINNSIDKWFDAQIEQALKSSIDLMQKYQNRLEKDIVEQSDILSGFISSGEYLFKTKYDQLEEFTANYIDKNRIDGIAVYNNQNIRISSQEKSFFYFNTFVNESIIKDILEKKSIARYEFVGNDQIYWVGHPIFSNKSNNIVIGALFIYKLVPVNEADKVTKILDSYNNYRQTKFFAEPVKNSYKILLVLITLLVVFAGIWGSLVYAKSITKPIELLAAASVEVSKGNLNIEVDVQGDDELAFMTRAFNSMVKRLKMHNDELNLKNEKLSEMFMQIARDNQYIDSIFKNVKSAIFYYTSRLEPLKTNDYAEEILRYAEAEFNDHVLIPASVFVAADEREFEFQIEMMIEGEMRTLTANITKIYDHEGKAENLVIVLDDITDLLNFQRVNIWKEIATRIAHEIKNPLTPIKLTAERVHKKTSAGGDTQDFIISSMETIINEVEGLQTMVNEFNMFARLPELKKDVFPLCVFLDEVASFYTASHPNVHIDIDCEDIEMFGDRPQLKRVFINLMSNSIDAMVNNTGSISISAVENQDRLRIIYEDSGKGIPSEDLHRIFIPYFSKKPDGTGLGLAIVKKIIEVHNGTVIAESEYGKYTRFIMEFHKAV
ncbi:integral membrane sensor signal transduction histidine kinase [Denitrovibrio acetiphilus DSM 12809]|uniref:histidine kinase n=1 Tax=Denitrovibrio acetiphilus (strain DSM 12809 / NBRC 114555 / N2460) TaxID=522772 RepID=D4H7Z1_DENA2|nr:ATP-binding protein [Denitrovibrio acetiphilus]ADD68140.1 integral membrane sensor signal transduction histidine kinase [Denitrovibrio acetiphilus DSM 12809]